MQKIKTYLIILAFGMVLSAIVPSVSDVHAHPHVFMVQRLNVVFDDKGLAGIKVRWKFDDMFASMIAEDHDTDRNGKLEGREIDSVRKDAFSFIAEFSYFTFVTIEKKPFQVKFIRDFTAILDNHKLVYEFLIPCHVSATRQPKKVTVASYDPSYYTAIYFTQERPVSLTGADGFTVKTSLREDPDTAIYFYMVHPWTLFLEFRQKS